MDNIFLKVKRHVPGELLKFDLQDVTLNTGIDDLIIEASESRAKFIASYIRAMMEDFRYEIIHRAVQYVTRWHPGTPQREIAEYRLHRYMESENISREDIADWVREAEDLWNQKLREEFNRRLPEYAPFGWPDLFSFVIPTEK